MIVLLDNYDSFTYNLFQMLSEFSEVKVVRNDEISIKEIEKLKPQGIVISPGIHIYTKGKENIRKFCGGDML